MSDKPKKAFIWDDVLDDEPNTKQESSFETNTSTHTTNLADDSEFEFQTPKGNQQINDADVSKIEIDEIDDEEEIEYYSDIPSNSHRIKRSRLLMIIILLLMICLYFVPVFKVETVAMNETSFVTKEQMLKSLEIEEGSRYSLYKMNTLKHNLDEESVTASSSKYSIVQSTLTVNVDEIKPLAKNAANDLYYEQNDEIYTSSEVNYYVPTIEGISVEQESSIVEELKQLDYNIIKEMSLITSANNQDRENLLYIQMKDGNYIEIGINQIALKMQYYMQIKEVIDEEANGEPGILHLNIGDYYEPL